MAIAIVIIIVCTFDPIAIPPIAVVIAVAIVAMENIRERGFTSWGGGMLMMFGGEWVVWGGVEVRPAGSTLGRCDRRYDRGKGRNDNKKNYFLSCKNYFS
jgi:hypothetical protein